MYSSYGKRLSVSQPFKMLVGHRQKSSDPSKGEAGNPTPLRQVFETQVVTTRLGNGVLANVKESETLLVLKVLSVDFGDAGVGNGAPFYLQDQIQILGKDYGFPEDRVASLLAGDHFGRGDGEGTGSIFDVAADLNSLINELNMGVKSSLEDANNLNHLYLRSTGVLDEVFIKVYSLSYLLQGGDPPFILEDKDGNVLYDPTIPETGSHINILQSRNFSPMEIS